jgi:hypothetical protein
LSNRGKEKGQYSDAYAKEPAKLIEAKSRGEKVTIKEEEELWYHDADVSLSCGSVKVILYSYHRIKSIYI